MPPNAIITTEHRSLVGVTAPPHVPSAMTRVLACYLLAVEIFFVVCANSQSALQARIDAASPGDTLLVEGGPFVGNITLPKRLALIGTQGSIVRGDGSGSVITITADSCIIRGLLIEHSGGMLVREDAGILLKSGFNTIEQNTLDDVLFGVYLLEAHRNTIQHNRIIGRKALELGERGSGVHIWNSQNNRLVSNVISDMRDGFYIQNANHTWIEGNEVFSLRYGLHYMYADSNTFLRNSFHDNVAGAAIMYSTGIVMRHNEFVNNRGFSSYGILFQDCHGMTADSNVIADNVVGMFLEASTNNRFRHNSIAQNDVALQVFANCAGNTFTENNFIDNLSPLTIVGRTTGSSWSVGGRGNYWSSYDGYDLDRDGIGDVPMKIQNVFNFLEGQRPNLRLYLYSPASQALAAATEAFPIIDINQERDRFPLMRPVGVNTLQIETTPLSKAGSASQPHHTIWMAIPMAGLVALSVFLLRRGKRGVV